jgi:glycosyltransferase involved in cell wall biosynthesis
MVGFFVGQKPVYRYSVWGRGENRTISPRSREMSRNLDDRVVYQSLLPADLPAGGAGTPCAETVLKLAEVTSEIVATVVIPAYNEEEGLPVVLERLYRSIDGRHEVLVVDDGSSDATSVVASRFPCGVIRHGRNCGKGKAMLTGVRHARADTVIFIDADGTYPPEAIPSMTRALESCDLVYGSRASGRDNIPRFNQLGNAFFQGIMRRVFRFQAGDYSTGLYGIKKRYLSRMRISSGGYAIEPEIAIKASRMNLRVRDMPVRYEQRIGATKLCGYKAGWQHLKIMARLAMWRPERMET